VEGQASALRLCYARERSAPTGAAADALEARTTASAHMAPQSMQEHHELVCRTGGWPAPAACHAVRMRPRRVRRALQAAQAMSAYSGWEPKEFDDAAVVAEPPAASARAAAAAGPISAGARGLGRGDAAAPADGAVMGGDSSQASFVYDAASGARPSCDPLVLRGARQAAAMVCISLQGTGDASSACMPTSVSSLKLLLADARSAQLQRAVRQLSSVCSERRPRRASTAPV